MTPGRWKANSEFDFRYPFSIIPSVMAERRLLVKDSTEHAAFQNVSKLIFPPVPEDEWDTEENLFNSGVVVAETKFKAYGVKGSVYLYPIQPAKDLETPLGAVAYEVKAANRKLWIAQAPLSIAVAVDPQPKEDFDIAYGTFLKIRLGNISYRLDLISEYISRGELDSLKDKGDCNDSITKERGRRQRDVQVAIPGRLDILNQVRVSFVNNTIQKNLGDIQNRVAS